MFFLSKSPNRETYFSSHMIKASHPRSNSSLSGGSYSTKIFGDQVFYRSTSINLYFFLFVIIICSPFIFFLQKIPTHSALLSQAASEWIEEHKQNKQYIV